MGLGFIETGGIGWGWLGKEDEKRGNVEDKGDNSFILIEESIMIKFIGIIGCEIYYNILNYVVGD